MNSRVTAQGRIPLLVVLLVVAGCSSFAAQAADFETISQNEKVLALSHKRMFLVFDKGSVGDNVSAARVAARLRELGYPVQVLGAEQLDEDVYAIYKGKVTKIGKGTFAAGGSDMVANALIDIYVESQEE